MERPLADASGEPGGASWDPVLYGRHARFVSDLGAPVLEWLAPAPGERILDLGCGDGALTERLALGGCTVVGVDASAAMVEAARARGVTARVADGRQLPFTEEFDAVFSNAALHWMGDSAAVIAGVARALRPGGRFVGEMGGEGNVAAIVGALRNALEARGIPVPEPWWFPAPEDFRRRLERGGFTVERLELFPRPTPLGQDGHGWLATFAGPFTAVVPEAERPAFLAEVVAALAPILGDPGGGWTADYVRLRFAARLSLIGPA